MYESGYYKDFDREKIAQAVQNEGFNPLLISDPPGTTYPPHTHPETKLLVFLGGEMEVRVSDQSFYCYQGDRLMIPGNTEHSAIVGPKGCQFFWSERLL